MIQALINWMAKYQLRGKTEVLVAPGARVNYRGMRYRPPAKLTVGSGSMFEGRIVADRPQAVVSIGCRSFIGNSLLVCAEGIDIGDDVLISWGCTLVDHHSHAVLWEHRKDDVRHWYAGVKDWTHVKISPIRIHNKAWIGFNSIVLSGVTIGEGAVIGCGSIVTRDVAPHTVVAGNPARFIRNIDNER